MSIWDQLCDWRWAHYGRRGESYSTKSFREAALNNFPSNPCHQDPTPPAPTQRGNPRNIVHLLRNSTQCLAMPLHPKTALHNTSLYSSPQCSLPYCRMANPYPPTSNQRSQNFPICINSMNFIQKKNQYARICVALHVAIKSKTESKSQNLDQICLLSMLC